MLACLLVGELDRLGRGARYTLSPWLIVAQRLAEVKTWGSPEGRQPEAALLAVPPITQNRRICA
jgi:hypothetical protein